MTSRDHGGLASPHVSRSTDFFADFIDWICYLIFISNRRRGGATAIPPIPLQIE